MSASDPLKASTVYLDALTAKDSDHDASVLGIATAMSGLESFITPTPDTSTVFFGGFIALEAAVTMLSHAREVDRLQVIAELRNVIERADGY
ncbi:MULTISPECIES: hypothetical protein [Sanguibacter]|mgnify:FL=1|jgi:hypothetical protein|uniref:Uncharacterized protein n=2 Tax=Sanguibacter TaxID=60919 RepID=A0A853EST4_9MICO|nr:MULTISPECIES: hypothetical protein [Sanguibacter]MBF0721308.1 hypothetical protein [Sanguibacter inulinus]NYS92453.1 hypothetical protein [Sanguibacter inulinus]WPF83672.1 hypothetical protein SANBI_001363 [Sanguibacter sp. 4.1]